MFITGVYKSGAPLRPVSKFCKIATAIDIYLFCTAIAVYSFHTNICIWHLAFGDGCKIFGKCVISCLIVRNARKYFLLHM